MNTLTVAAGFSGPGGLGQQAGTKGSVGFAGNGLAPGGAGGRLDVVPCAPRLAKASLHSFNIIPA